MRRGVAPPAPTGPLPWLRIRLHPQAPVPLHRQLAAQVTAALREGRLAPGQRLPSGRDLARRLGIDRGTVLAAYRHLAGEGLVEVKAGSGAYARPPLAPELSGSRASAPDAFRAFVARERQRGADTLQLETLFARWRSAVRSRRVVVAEEEPELRGLWRRELQAWLPGARVETAAPAELRRAPARAAGAVVAAPARQVRPLRASLPPWVEVVPLRPPGGSRERRLLLQLAVGAVIVLVSMSPTLRRRFRELAVGLRGREVAALALPPEPTPRLERSLRVARFVLADEACRPVLEGRLEPRRLLGLRVLDPAVAAEIAGRLALPPPGGRSLQPSRGERRRRRA